MDNEDDIQPEIEKAEPAIKKTVKKKSKKKSDEALVKNTIEINPSLSEALDNTVVLGWGRMNPITVGHEKLVNKIKSVAKQNSATPKVFISHSQDAKKNPLDYDDKIMLAKKAFGNSIIVKSKSKTIIQIMAELQSKFSKVILVVGQDRIKDFETLLNKYNGKDYEFDSIEVVSAGDRDPDAEGVSGMSASKMRAAAFKGDLKSFKSGLPKKLEGDADDIYDMVRYGMKIAEEMELDEAVLSIAQRRQRSLTMRKFAGKIANARKRMAARPATKAQLVTRATKAATVIIRKKVAGKKGVGYADLAPSAKMAVDKKVAKKSAAIKKIAKKLLPKVKMADKLKRQKAADAKKNEEVDLTIDEAFDLFLEEFELPVVKKRYHKMYEKGGKIKLDRRFRAFKKRPDALDPLLAAQMEVEEFVSDSELISFIESTADDIFDSVTLNEERILESLQAKAQKAGIEIELINHIYEEAIESYIESETMDIEQWAFSSVNAAIANMTEAKKSGLWDNIHKKRKRIKSGSNEKMRKPGTDGAPSEDDFENARKEEVDQADEGIVSTGIAKVRAGHYNRKANKSFNKARGALGYSKGKSIAKGTSDEDGFAKHMKKASDYERKAKKIKSDAFRKTKKFASYKGNLRDDPPRPPYKSKLRDDPPHIQKWSKESVEQVDEENRGSSSKHPPVKVGDKFTHANITRVVTKVTPDGIEATRTNGTGKTVHDHGYVQKQIVESVEQVDKKIDEAFSDIFNERSPSEIAKFKVGSLVFKKQYKLALDALIKVLTRKRTAPVPGQRKPSVKHSISYYAAEIAKSYNHVDGKTLEKLLPKTFVFEDALEWGTDESANKYKKDTPGQTVNESFNEMFAEDVTQSQLNDVEKFADRILSKFKVDIEFTRHFADRMNDPRNNPPITIADLQQVFKKIAKKKASDIRQNPDSEAIIKDLQKDLNMPVVINYDKNKDEFEVVTKTIMRKKNFKSNDTVINTESIDEAYVPPYDVWHKLTGELSDAMKDAGDEMRKLSPGGEITPNEVKSSPKFKAAKVAYNKAKAANEKLLKSIPTKIRKEYQLKSRADRRAR